MEPTTPPFLKKLLTRGMQKAAHDSSQYTIQFFIDGKRDLPSATGSGVLITVENDYYMITAAHVIAGRHQDIYIILPTMELTLGGMLYYTPNMNSDSCEQLDIAVMQLNEQVVQKIKERHSFLPMDKIRLKYTQPADIPDRLLIFGYPASQTNIKWSRNVMIQPKFEPKPFVHFTESIIPYPFEKYGLHEASNLAMRFDGKVQTFEKEGLENAPNPEGISGCGIWLTNPYTGDIRLIGIETCREPKEQALIGTRIDVVFEVMRRRFGLHIPEYTAIRLIF